MLFNSSSCRLGTLKPAENGSYVELHNNGLSAEVGLGCVTNENSRTITSKVEVWKIFSYEIKPNNG